jgi:hypothetical protein
MIKLPAVAAEHREAGLDTTPDYLRVSRSNPKASGQLALQELADARPRIVPC